MTGIDQGLAHRLEIGGFTVTHFDEGTSGEIDSKTQASRHDRTYGDGDQYQGEHQRNLAFAHEIDVLLAFEYFHG